MSQPNIDPDAFEEMKSEMGEVFIDILQTFIATMPEQMQLLKTAIDGDDAQNVFAVAHRIKSSSSSIGALGLANTAEQIELTGREGSTEGTAKMYQALQVKMEDVVAFLQQQLQHL